MVVVGLGILKPPALAGARKILDLGSDPVLGRAFQGTRTPALSLAFFTGQATPLKPPTPSWRIYTLPHVSPQIQGQMGTQRQTEKKLGGRGVP